MESLGRVVRNEVVGFEIIDPTDDIKDKLFLTNEDDKVIYIERIRYGDDIVQRYAVTSVAVNYGGDAHTIANNKGLPIKEAEKIYNDFMRGFPGIYQYQQHCCPSHREDLPLNLV